MTATLAELLGPVMTRVGLPLLIGAETLNEHAAPPRIVWVPSVDQFTAAQQGEFYAASRLTCVAGFDVHVWGASFDAARELRRKLVDALHLEYSGSYSIVSAEWVAFDRPEWLRDGQAWVARVTLSEPLTEDTQAITSMVAETDELLSFPDAASGDGKLDAVES
jgi:hypothetical protein